MWKYIYIDMYELFALEYHSSQVRVCVCVCVRVTDLESVHGYLFVCVFVCYTTTPCVRVPELANKSWHLKFDASVRRSIFKNLHTHALTHTHMYRCA